MDYKRTEKGNSEKSMPQPNMRHPNSDKNIDNSSSGPTFLLLYVWNWLASIPTTITNMFAGFKNGEFFAKFSVIDAMLQFIFAVATSCHPQEDGVEEEELKSEKSSPVKPKGDLKIFGGSGRTLRSRTIETES